MPARAREKTELTSDGLCYCLLAGLVGMPGLSAQEPWLGDAVDVSVTCAQFVPGENVIQGNETNPCLARSLAHHLVKIQLGVLELRKGLVRVTGKPWTAGIGGVLVTERCRGKQERVPYRHDFRVTGLGFDVLVSRLQGRSECAALKV